MRTSGTANEWDLTVPGDDSELVAEFHRHGVRPGQRIHISVVAEDPHKPDETLPSFFDSFDGPADLAERSSEILQAEFPKSR